jgi:hypothetical protein
MIPACSLNVHRMLIAGCSKATFIVKNVIELQPVSLLPTKRDRSSFVGWVDPGVFLVKMILINMLMLVHQNMYTHQRVLLVLTDCGILGGGA